MRLVSETTTPECQWCGSDDTYAAGYSPMCTETQYKCRDCRQETWQDDKEVAQ
jgi:transposase-like protein